MTKGRCTAKTISVTTAWGTPTKVNFGTHRLWVEHPKRGWWRQINHQAELKEFERNRLPSQANLGAKVVHHTYHPSAVPVDAECMQFDVRLSHHKVTAPGSLTVRKLAALLAADAERLHTFMQVRAIHRSGNDQRQDPEPYELTTEQLAQLDPSEIYTAATTEGARGWWGTQRLRNLAKRSDLPPGVTEALLESAAVDPITMIRNGCLTQRQLAGLVNSNPRNRKTVAGAAPLTRALLDDILEDTTAGTLLALMGRPEESFSPSQRAQIWNSDNIAAKQLAARRWELSPTQIDNLLADPSEIYHAALAQRSDLDEDQLGVLLATDNVRSEALASPSRTGGYTDDYDHGDYNHRAMRLVGGLTVAEQLKVLKTGTAEQRKQIANRKVLADEVRQKLHSDPAVGVRKEVAIRKDLPRLTPKQEVRVLVTEKDDRVVRHAVEANGVSTQLLRKLLGPNADRLIADPRSLAERQRLIITTVTLTPEVVNVIVKTGHAQKLALRADAPPEFYDLGQWVVPASVWTTTTAALLLAEPKLSTDIVLVGLALVPEWRDTVAKLVEFVSGMAR